MALELAFGDHLEAQQLAEFAEHALAVREAKGARAAVGSLIDLIGVRPMIRDDSYYEAALDYYLAIIHAKRGRPELATEHLRRSGVLPATGGGQLFADHVRESLELNRHREAARDRGMPSFLIASMRRSASATLTQTIAAMIDLPRLRISLDDWLSPNWLDAVSPGGAMLHDHFNGALFNIQVLRRAGVREIFVLVRDPRAAAASSFALKRKRTMAERLSADEYERGLLDLYFAKVLPWLEGWIEAAGSGDLGFEVHWIHSIQVRTDMAAVWARLVEVLGPLYPRIREYGPDRLPELKANFVHGDDEAWREVVSGAGQDRMWQAISPAARELLQLHP